MPFVMYDADISGTGAASLTGASVFYVAWDVTALGYLARHSGSIDDLQVDHVGGWALGDTFDIVGGSPVDRWHEFIWMNVEFGLWTPFPSNSPGGFLSCVATRIRWALSPGTTAHLHVFGDS